MASILLVDDSPEIRRTIERLLTSAGHTVAVAADGAAGLRALETAAFDLVLTDIVMPDMEGLEMIRRIRKTHPSLPIIAMSGGGRGTANDYLGFASNFGAAKTLEKPFAFDVLSAAIDEVLGA